MAKFLHSRAGTTPADEILEQNVLSLPLLRSLIAGDFYLGMLDDCFVLLHEKGLFVLKQCHQNGIIQASAGVWTDTNYLGDSTEFPDPLVQNRENIARLSQMLKLPPEDFHSCILFDTQCELRRVPESGATFSVLHIDQLEAHFACLLPTLPVRYTHTQLEALHDIFLLVSAADPCYNKENRK